MIARKTLDAIDRQMRKDNGASFRQLQAQTLPLCADAYRGEEESRGYLGASSIGTQCPRKLFYGFRWASKGEQVDPAMLRLWNRGHLEEGRMVALLLMIGVNVHQFDTNGEQYAIEDHGGHYRGHLDGVLVGIPDVPTGEPALGEFKTHNADSYDALTSNGLQSSKFEHFIQMQEYMLYRKLRWGFYMAVNKNNDKLHAEIIELNPQLAQQYSERARGIIVARQPPQRISDKPSWYQCKFCEAKRICHFNEAPLVNCRTCINAHAADGGWACALADSSVRIPKEVQRVGCPSYQRAPWS